MAKQETAKRTNVSRRGFLGYAAGATAVAATQARRASAQSPNDRLGVGVIGTGGRGNGHLQIMKWIAARGRSCGTLGTWMVAGRSLQRSPSFGGSTVGITPRPARCWCPPAVKTMTPRP